MKKKKGIETHHTPKTKYICKKNIYIKNVKKWVY